MRTIGSLLKELGVAAGRYVAYRGKRMVGIAQQPAGATSPVPVVPPPVPLEPVKAFTPRGQHEWQTVHAHEQAYDEQYNVMVDQFMRFPPRLTLDVGCNTGMLGSVLATRYPGSKHWGIEPDQGAAAIAAGRLDRVLAQPAEDIDWAQEGVGVGTFDTVFLLDVLEHMYDPWKALLTIRGMLNRGAQVLVSIPNMRNILMMQDLANGTFRYRRIGLLDITHIRFFTHDDLMRTFYQTGFRVVLSGLTTCEPAKALYQRYADKPFPQKIEAGRLTVEVTDLADLQKLCAVQNLYTLEPADYADLSPEERRWIDDPHPETLSYAGVTG